MTQVEGRVKLLETVMMTEVKMGLEETVATALVMINVMEVMVNVMEVTRAVAVVMRASNLRFQFVTQPAARAGRRTVSSGFELSQRLEAQDLLPLRHVPGRPGTSGPDSNERPPAEEGVNAVSP
uniref:Uncharacterized protein n=1 Tax=Rangifer tarandus platyrhynchus TaxID=3082113 RepID=A0ACB0FDH5_RANTA|nr:unnamed protein product [Rangifer tarandus platyrhynchus]